MKDWKVWVIFACFAVILFLWLRGNRKPVEDPKIIKLEQQVKDRDSEILELTEQMHVQGEAWTKTEAKYLQKLDSTGAITMRLQRRLRKIDTSRATAADLDSILNKLYP